MNDLYLWAKWSQNLRFVKASNRITCNLALLNYKHVYNAIYNLYIGQINNARRCNIFLICTCY